MNFHTCTVWSRMETSGRNPHYSRSGLGSSGMGTPNERIVVQGYITMSR